MPFRRMTKSAYPPRLWALVGYPGSGKSTFATQMHGPILVIDADHRFREVLDLAGERDVYELSDIASDNTDPDRVAVLLAENMPGSEIGTVVVDSLTAIIAPIVTQAMVDKDAGRIENLAQGWRKKALAMRQLQDAVTRWGTDSLWIYHLQDARDARAQEVVRATVSETERARLTRSINLQIEILQENTDPGRNVQGDGRRGIKVVWARRGRSGMTLWDETGSWVGMPEKIEEAVYGGLSQEEQDQIEQETPAVFPSSDKAIAWGFEQGVFQALQHARNAYEKLKVERKPADAYEMARLWVADVQARQEAINGNGAG
jgi:hypothetical protein